MKKIKTKGKEFLKVAMVCTLSIGMFSAVFSGVNNIAFRAATDGATPLTLDTPPLTASADSYTQQVQQQDEVTERVAFMPPSLTVLKSPEQHVAIPASAMPMEEAAQIGAEYIWDVFGESIDGMYVIMTYTAWVGHGRQHWFGMVALTREATGVDFDWDSVRILADTGSTITDRIVIPVDPMFTFLIDATTGERVDISYSTPRSRQSQEQIESRDRHIAWRGSEQDRAIHSMDDNELMAYLGITLEQLEAYTQEATAYAQSHFNNSTISNVMLGQMLVDAAGSPMLLSGIGVGPHVDENGNIYVSIDRIMFTITDNTGREALVSISTGQGSPRFINISTQANDIIPGFSYDRPGLG